MSTDQTAPCRRCESLRFSLSVQTKRSVDMEAAQDRATRAEGARKWAEQQMLEAKTEADRQRLRAVDIGAELARFVIEHNITHLDDCSEDDNCRCPHVERINRLLRDCPGETTDGQDRQILVLRLELETRTAQLQRSEAERQKLANEAKPVFEIGRKMQEIRALAAAELTTWADAMDQLKTYAELLSTTTLPKGIP